MIVDNSLFQLINGFALRYFFLDAGGIFLAYYFPYVLVVSLILFLIWDFKKYWKVVLGGLISAGLGWVIVELVRRLFFVARPFVSGQVNLLLPHLATSSFPSGHATFFFALSFFLFFHNKKAGTVFLVLSFLIGLARVFSGLHWPSDIFGGLIFGLVAAFIIKEVFRHSLVC